MECHNVNCSLLGTRATNGSLHALTQMQKRAVIDLDGPGRPHVILLQGFLARPSLQLA